MKLRPLSIAAALAMGLPSCAGWSYRFGLGYDKATATVEIYRPASGKEPVQVLK